MEFFETEFKEEIVKILLREKIIKKYKIKQDFGITEDNLIRCFKRGQSIMGFTNFLISHDINNCLLVNFLCKSMEEK